MAGDRRSPAVCVLRRKFARREHGCGRVAPQRWAQTIVRVLLTGGGTGGHVYPALAIAEVLREQSQTPPELLFVGNREGLEARAVPAEGIPMQSVASRPLERRASLALVRTVLANVAGFAQALRVVGRFRPDCVIATGGYVSVPVVLAARMLRAAGASRARIALIEPNVTPGLANRMLAPFVDETWREAPVRASIVRPLASGEARRSLGLEASRTTVVVMGGSQGALRINEAVAGAARDGQLPPEWQVLLVTGMRNAGDVPLPGVVSIGYLDDPALAYAAADIVVARAGASTLAELRATATPAILVPYPHAGAHQAANAEAVRAAGSARVILDADLTPARLVAELQLALEPAALRALREAARARAAGDGRARIFERYSALAARG